MEYGDDASFSLWKRDCAVGGNWGGKAVVDRVETARSLRPQIHCTCLMRLVNSCTRLYTSRSSRIMRAIFEVAWITVVWSRPPNCLPIFGSEESVS